MLVCTTCSILLPYSTGNHFLLLIYDKWRAQLAGGVILFKLAPGGSGTGSAISDLRASRNSRDKENCGPGKDKVSKA